MEYMLIYFSNYGVHTLQLLEYTGAKEQKCKIKPQLDDFVQNSLCMLTLEFGNYLLKSLSNIIIFYKYIGQETI